MDESNCKECNEKQFSQCYTNPCAYIKQLSLADLDLIQNSSSSINYTSRKDDINCLDKFTVNKLLGDDRISTLDSLLSKGANINKLNYDGDLLIGFACRKGHRDLVKLLLKNRANPNQLCRSNRKLLSQAILSGCTHIVDLLVEYGCNVTEVFQDDDRRFRQTYLHQAISENRPKMVKRLLHWGVDPNACTGPNTSWNQLHPNILELLLSHGLNIESVTRERVTLARRFIKPVLDSNDPLDVHFYEMHYNEEKTFNNFQVLIKHVGIDRCEKHENDVSGCSLLHFAINNRNIAYLKHLLELGVNPNSRKALLNWTPLHVAARNSNNMTQMKLLLEYGAEIEATDSDGNTPLHIAVFNRNHQAVRDLLFFGARPYVRNSKGKSAIDLALDKDDDKSIEWMMLFGVEICEIERLAYRELSHLMVREMLAKYIIKKKMVWMVEDVNVITDEDLKQFKDECQNELNRMKTLKIRDSDVNCFDLLHASKRGLANIASKWLGNELKEFFNDLVPGNFPIYAYWLWRNINVAMKYGPVYNKAFESLNKIINFKLPSLVIEQVMIYLNDEHMKNLIELSQK